MFPDYEPKRTPDTFRDMIGIDNMVAKHLEEISEPTLEKLKTILDLFNKYKPEAEKNPGHYQEGNPILGAPEEEYIPSEEAILVSELGKLIRFIHEWTSMGALKNYLQKHEIPEQKVVYTEIYFCHMDVMGSGRFIYAGKVEPEISLEL